MYYIVISENNSSKMFWTGKDLSFDKKKRKAYGSYYEAQKEKTSVTKKHKYLKQLLRLEPGN